MKKGKNWTEEDLKEFYSRQNKPIPEHNLKILQDMGMTKFIKNPVENSSEPKKTKKKRKRSESRSVISEPNKVETIISSIRTCLIYSRRDEFGAAFWFEGARLLTLNEIIAINQFSKFRMFGYKKAVRKTVREACLMLGDRSQLAGPLKLTLYRRGRKRVDLDSLPAMFKFMLDSLTREGMIDDDNPEIIVEIVNYQEVGEPALGMKLETLSVWTAPDLSGLKERWLKLEAKKEESRD